MSFIFVIFFVVTRVIVCLIELPLENIVNRKNQGYKINRVVGDHEKG